MTKDKTPTVPPTERGVSQADRIVTVSITLISQGFQAISVGAIALFLPLIRADLGFSYTQAGILSSLATLTYAVMQIPSGLMADRFGPRKLFFFGSLITNMLAFAFGSVTAFWVFLPIQTVAGVFRAFMFVPGLMLVVTWFPPNRRATAMGIYVVGGFLGNVVLSVAGPALAGAYGWRMPFHLFSSMGVFASIAYVVLSKESPSAPHREPVNIGEMLALFRYRTMWLAGGIQYVRLAVVFGLRFWIPSYLADEKGVSLVMIGAIVAVSGGISAPANLLGGYVSDRLRNPPMVIGGSLLVLGVAIALLAVVDNLAVLVLLIFVTSLFQQFYFGPLFAAPVEILGLRSAGVNIGFSNSFANFGALTFGYGIGALKDFTGGFRAGFYALAASCVVGLVLTMLLAKARSEARRSDQAGTVPTPG
jgi:sugar phosphate permease